MIEFDVLISHICLVALCHRSDVALVNMLDATKVSCLVDRSKDNVLKAVFFQKTTVS